MEDVFRQHYDEHFMLSAFFVLSIFFRKFLLLSEINLGVKAFWILLEDLRSKAALKSTKERFYVPFETTVDEKV
jgi:hypothetical protein